MKLSMSTVATITVLRNHKLDGISRLFRRWKLVMKSHSKCDLLQLMYNFLEINE